MEQVAVHMRNNSIYWCGRNTSSGGGIYRTHPDGSGLTNIVSTGVGRRGIRGIAVDWVAREYHNTYLASWETEHTFCW